jgi:hypothetical protein
MLYLSLSTKNGLNISYYIDLRVGILHNYYSRVFRYIDRYTNSEFIRFMSPLFVTIPVSVNSMSNS